MFSKLLLPSIQLASRRSRDEWMDEMPALADTTALNHLGAVVQKLRELSTGPPWDAAGIRTTLEQALAGWDYVKVHDIAAATALDPTAKTPAAILHRLRNGWSAPKPSDQPATPTAVSVSSLRCQHCGLLNTEGDDHRCQPRTTDPHEGRELARQAMQAAISREDEQ